MVVLAHPYQTLFAHNVKAMILKADIIKAMLKIGTTIHAENVDTNGVLMLNNRH